MDRKVTLKQKGRIHNGCASSYVPGCNFEFENSGLSQASHATKIYLKSGVNVYCYISVDFHNYNLLRNSTHKSAL